MKMNRLSGEIGILLLCLVFLFPHICSATETQNSPKVDMLIELLISKEIVSAEEAEQIMVELSDSPAESTKPDARVNTKGHLKLQYQATENDSQVNSDTIRIRQARIEFFGDLQPEYSYKLSFAAERTDPTLLDAFIRYKSSDRFNLTLGQFKLPFSRESLTSGKAIDLAERAWFLDRYRPANARDIGLKAAFSPSENIKLEIGAFHGNGKNSKDSNDQKLFVGRVSGSFEYGPFLLQPEIAVMKAASENDGAAPIDQAVSAISGFAPYDKFYTQWGLVSFYKDFSFKYEFMEGRFKPKTDAVSTIITNGMYAQLGKSFAGNKEVFFRLENYDDNTRATTSGDIEWYTLGLKYKYAENIRYKMNYTWKKEAVNSVDNDRLSLEAVVTY